MSTPIMPDFGKQVLKHLKRFDECVSDGQAVDISRDWFDLLTHLGLLKRVQRSPALWEITDAGEAALAMAEAQAPAPVAPPSCSCRTPEAAETRRKDNAEAVELQRILLASHRGCRPANTGLMGWAAAALAAPVTQGGPSCPDCLGSGIYPGVYGRHECSCKASPPPVAQGEQVAALVEALEKIGRFQAKDEACGVGWKEWNRAGQYAKGVALDALAAYRAAQPTQGASDHE